MDLWRGRCFSGSVSVEWSIYVAGVSVCEEGTVSVKRCQCLWEEGDVSIYWRMSLLKERHIRVWGCKCLEGCYCLLKEGDICVWDCQCLTKTDTSFLP